jgi:hypothetical protein
MYLSVIIRHTLIPSLSRSKIFVLRSFRSLSFNRIWLDQNPTPVEARDLKTGRSGSSFSEPRIRTGH